MECNCNNNNNGGVIPWVRGNRLPLCICIYQMNVEQGTVSTMAYNNMTRTPYAIQADDTVTVTMKSGFRSVEMPFTTDGNKVLVIDNGELPTGTYTVEVTIERGSGERGRWQESRQVRIYENTDEAILGEMYSIEADLFFWAKGDTGVGIANITSNPDDTLTITMTDGTTYTTQAMKGDKGDKGDTGERGVSIVSFDVTGQTETSVIYTVTFSDDTTEEVAVPKGPQGDTGLTGNGISSTTLNSDYTLTISYTDGTTYTTPSIRGAQGVQGVSIIAFTQTGETATNTLYNVVFSDGRTQSVAIPKGLKGDKGDTGNTGSQGVQGPKGDTVTATDYTLYNVQGSSSEGAMSQDATTKAISAQTGYYTCGAAADKVDKVAAVENGNLYKRTLGGHFKVKMTNKNTAASGVTLQIGSETAAALWYNGVAASASNTWDAGEVLSVYYDGTYYQASNAQGGGSAGKKRLTGATGYLTTNGDSIGAYNSLNTWRYIKYSVNPGDVIMISGQGGSSPRLYAIAKANDDIIQKEETVNVIRKNFVLVMPEEAKWIVLNNNYSTYPNYEWYYAKAGSVGAHEMLTESYLYEDLRTLAIGQSYKKDESVKTTEKQLRKFIKDVGVLSLYETLAVGDLRINSNATYRAASAVNTFDPNPSTPYSAGAYALGSVTEYILTVSSDSITAGNITVNGTEVAIETTDDADAIAAKIADALNIDGWSDSANENIVTVRCNTIGNNTTTITISVGDTGVVVSGNSTPSIRGTDAIMKYDGESWAVATPSGMATDGVLVEVDEAWLITNATEQNSITKELTRTRTVPLKAETIKSGRFLQANNGSAFNTLVSASNSYYVTNYMDCSGADRINIFCTRSTTCKYCGVIFYDATYHPVKTIVNTTGNDQRYDLEVPKNAVYVRTTVWADPNCGTLTYTDKIKDVAISNEERIVKNEKDISALDTRLEDVEEGLDKTLSTTELIDYSSLSTASHEANVSVTVDADNSSIDFYCITSAASKRGALYLPSGMVAGRKYRISFDYSYNGTGDRWFSISNNYTDASLTYYWWKNLAITSNGHLEDIITYTPNMKMFVIGSSSIGTGKHLILKNLSIREELNFKIIQTRLSGLEDTAYDIPSYITPHEYYGEALSFKTHKFGSELYMNISLTGTGQGGANYGDFYFVGTNNGITFNVFNLKTKTKLGTFNVEAPSISNCHCNTLVFSNQFYETSDEFPVLYVCSGYGIGDSPKTFCVYGYRIINNEGVFSATLVHTITIVGSGGWIEFVIDNESRKAYIRLDSTWYNTDMPRVSAGDTTIDLSTLESMYVQPGVAGSGQGHLFYRGKIYLTADNLNTSGVHHLYALDVATGRFSAIIDTALVYNAETENVFVYDEHLFIGYRSRIYKLYFD